MGFYSGVITKDDSFNRLILRVNTSHSDPQVNINVNTLENGENYTVSFNVDSFDKEHSKAVISNFQLEKGETFTEYEPYQEFTSDTVVTKVSAYTLHAIWEKAS